jgi:hypothetical protein
MWIKLHLAHIVINNIILVNTNDVRYFDQSSNGNGTRVEFKDDQPSIWVSDSVFDIDKELNAEK